MVTRRTSDEPHDYAGNRMAERIATGVASLLGVAIVAAGGYLVTLSGTVAELRGELGRADRELFELHDTLNQFPKPVDLIRCSERLATVERTVSVHEHQISKLEASE